MNIITLNNGVTMPQLGFGSWRVPDDEAERAVRVALDAGYRSIDTAKLYRNEEGVGRAVRESGIPRDELFVTTKLWNRDHGHDNALRAFDASVERLGLDVVDLYLIHWPCPAQGRYVETWKALERLYADGRVRAIGVSNFTAETLDRLLAEAEVVPAVNQIELHPQLGQAEMRAVGAKHGIVTEAWSPLGQGQGLLDLPLLAEIGGRYGKSPAQAVLRWHIQLGHLVIPKSVTPARIRENIEVFDFALDQEEMDAITALDSGRRLGPDPVTFD
ncbi:aldo/keto reductase [Sphaerimonospora thailandensis]|uniref:Oxidoreductase n=1 Tax=Sphaerimonospora thailandensis TaxID=795644 RepID=A0A8J3RDK4_9ACTN|nr:aldo/keto reductase [Sphaerimonospora thailandensis]GIH71829.1 oxidoreductase [Sphaerimonospora thailandensis]